MSRKALRRVAWVAVPADFPWPGRRVVVETEHPQVERPVLAQAQVAGPQVGWLRQARVAVVVMRNPGGPRRKDQVRESSRRKK